MLVVCGRFDWCRDNGRFSRFSAEIIRSKNILRHWQKTKNEQKIMSSMIKGMCRLWKKKNHLPLLGGRNICSIKKTNIGCSPPKSRDYGNLIGLFLSPLEVGQTVVFVNESLKNVKLLQYFAKIWKIIWKNKKTPKIHHLGLESGCENGVKSCANSVGRTWACGRSSW